MATVTGGRHHVNPDFKAFTRFLTARAAATLAYQMAGVAIGWQMYDLTGSPLAFGLVGLVQFIPSPPSRGSAWQRSCSRSRRRLLFHAWLWLYWDGAT